MLSFVFCGASIHLGLSLLHQYLGSHVEPVYKATLDLLQNTGTTQVILRLDRMTYRITKDPETNQITPEAFPTNAYESTSWDYFRGGYTLSTVGLRLQNKNQTQTNKRIRRILILLSLSIPVTLTLHAARIWLASN